MTVCLWEGGEREGGLVGCLRATRRDAPCAQKTPTTLLLSRPTNALLLLLLGSRNTPTSLQHTSLLLASKHVLTVPGVAPPLFPASVFSRNRTPSRRHSHALSLATLTHRGVLVRTFRRHISEQDDGRPRRVSASARPALAAAAPELRGSSRCRPLYPPGRWDRRLPRHAEGRHGLVPDLDRQALVDAARLAVRPRLDRLVRGE